MKNAKGLSLVEILISLAIIGVVIVAVAGSMANNLRVSSSTNEQSLAMEYVNGALEQYRIYWKSAANYNAAATPPRLSDLNRMLPSTFTVRIRADDLDLNGSAATASPPPMRKVSITVTRSGRTLARGATLIGNPN